MNRLNKFGGSEIPAASGGTARVEQSTIRQDRAIPVGFPQAKAIRERENAAGAGGVGEVRRGGTDGDAEALMDRQVIVQPEQGAGGKRIARTGGTLDEILREIV